MATAEEVKSMQSTTMHTYLGYAATGTAYTKLVDIKDFPDLGGEPDQVETTTLSNEKQTFLLGVQSMSSMTFAANYVPEQYDELEALADGTIHKFCLSFGETGEYGIFTWEGQLSVWVTGGGVNAAREMTISISAATEVKKDSVASFTVTG